MGILVFDTQDCQLVSSLFGTAVLVSASFKILYDSSSLLYASCSSVFFFCLAS